jgi:hypothetical protein
MAESTKSAASEVADSKEFSVRVKDLASPETNPNFPRSIFATPMGGAANADADTYVSVTDGTHVPGSGFKEKSVKAQAIQMNTGFDANGVPGNSGDWLVHVNGHWFVTRDI